MIAGATGIVANGDARLHRVGNQTVVDQFQRGDMGGVLERLINGTFVFFDETPVVTQVRRQIVMHLGRARFHGFLHVDDGGQIGDVQHDGFGGIAGL